LVMWAEQNKEFIEEARKKFDENAEAGDAARQRVFYQQR